MLTEAQVLEIREHLEKAQNPLFFFDNDPDGLCSFLILQKYGERGRGIPIRSFPDLEETYFRKILELNPDYVFILDKPTVSRNFFDRVHELNLPIVWIDHHEIDSVNVPDFVNYYNPLYNESKKNEPVTALSYQVNSNEKLIWLAVAGCVADKYFPDFYPMFKKLYSDLAIDSEDAFDIFYNSLIGKIARIFSFALKDRTTNVINMIRFLTKANSPYEVLEQIDFKYQKLLGKAILIGKKLERILFFQYGGDLSISSDLANELSYKFSDKVIVVIYVTGVKANISIRGKSIREKVIGVIENLENATGGGHEDAVGAQIQIEDLETFKGELEKVV